MSQFFFRFWWAIVFLLFCYGFYVHGMETKRKCFDELDKKAAYIKEQLELARDLQSELRLQIESQSDPAWREMLMMKRLGMVPKGQIKVYFEE